MTVRNQEMRFDLDPLTGLVTRVEMQVRITGELTDDRDLKTHAVEIVKALVIPGDQLSVDYKAALESVADAFLNEYRAKKP